MGMLLRALLLAVLAAAHAQEGAQYLHSAIAELRNLNALHNRRVDSVPHQTRRVHRTGTAPGNVPPLSLTKGELAALYESAISKGHTVNIDHGDGPPIHAAVHELEDHPSWEDADHTDPPDNQEKPEEDGTGYYYYYYPLKSFMNEMASQSSASGPEKHPHYEEYYHHHPHYHHEITTAAPTILPQYHSHTHKHTVKITKDMMPEDKKSKALEPLFMAISGFIGMAVMFVMSVLVLPKLGIMKSRDVKEDAPEVSSIARIALQAIEGRDCAERLACELGKTARALNLYDNRFVKLLRRITPKSFVKQIDKVGKYMDKKHRCAAIQCKRKNGPPKKNKPQNDRN